MGGGVIPSRHGRTIFGVSGCLGGKNLGFHKSHGCKKITSAAEGGRKNLAFFLVQNQNFGGKMTNWAFQNFADVRFATFSILTGVSFGKNEISTDVRFWDFFLGQKHGREGGKNPLTP